MNSDGSHRIKLTQANPNQPTFASGFHPVWSPDGKQIAFTRTMPPEVIGNSDVFVINADGTQERQITWSIDSSEEVNSWSNDGKYLYVTYVDGSIVDSLGRPGNNSVQLGRINLPGDSLQTLTDPSNGGSGGIISRDDSLLTLGAFVPFTVRGGMAYQLQIMDLHSGIRRPIRENACRYEYAADWSPTNQQILFNTIDDATIPYQNAPRQILIINLDGTGLTNITPFDYKTSIHYATSWRRH